MVHSSKYLILRDLKLFRSLDHQQIEQIAHQASYEKFSKGSYLFKTGDEVKSVYILNNGSVKSGIQTNEDKIFSGL